MSGLCTDLYEIRMAASYLRRGMTAPATFSLFARRLPRDRGFLVCAGVADCLDFLAGFRFTDDELGYLADVVGLPGQDVRALSRLRFTGDVRAVPEGRVVSGSEPLLEVTAALPQAQLVETGLLNLMTFQSAVATKAARCSIAAPHAELVDFAARRTHGLDAADAVARAAAIAGFSGTSYVAAARRYGLQPVGTMAHSYVEAFPDERSAFLAFAEDFPGTTTFLVDTYDSLDGVRTALDVAREKGLHVLGIRLDSGDLGALAGAARRQLDEAGFPDARILASGGLDEYALDALTAAGAPIDAYGVGTRMGVSADAPSLDSVYKLVEYDGRPVMKLSVGKLTAPGAKQVYRGAPGEDDILTLHTEKPIAHREALLEPVMREGEPIGTDSLAAARERCATDLQWLPSSARWLRRPTPPAVLHSPSLRQLTESVQRLLRP